MSIKEAFILAGGKGERLRPLTNKIPKPLLLVKGKPILQYNIEAMASFGVKKIVLGVGYRAEQIKEVFGGGGKFGIEIIYSVEKEFLGTGGALKFASEYIEGRFIMVNGDNLADFNFASMLEVHERNNALGTIALVSVGDVSQYGVAELEKEKIVKFVEKPAKGEEPSNLINAGAYILEREAVDLMPEGFCLIEKTMFPELAEREKLFGHMHKGQWFPTDTLEKYEKAKKEFSV